MSKTLEELKQLINEEEAALIIKARQQQLSLLEQEVFEKLQMRLIDEEGMKELPSVDILQKICKKGPSFEMQSASDKAIGAIFANFEREFGKENIKNNNLCFNDNSQANAFFQHQAYQGHAFLFKEVNADNYAFSDGQDHYKMGSKAEIIAFCKKNSIPSPQFDETADDQEELSSSARHH